MYHLAGLGSFCKHIQTTPISRVFAWRTSLISLLTLERLCHLGDGISGHSQQITVPSSLLTPPKLPPSPTPCDLLVFWVFTACFPTHMAKLCRCHLQESHLWAVAGTWQTPALLPSAAVLGTVLHTGLLPGLPGKHSAHDRMTSAPHFISGRSESS